MVVIYNEASVDRALRGIVSIDKVEHSLERDYAITQLYC